jgi:UDP-N-acetylglucosamine--N-acetylmuramyl-(pentapeptide) pyrophosphoryl-undecaprenol N-acetylglucosamine transferase
LDAEDINVIWLGREGALEETLVQRAGLPFFGIQAAPMVGVGVFGRLRNLIALASGMFSAWRFAGRERPDALLVTGGYVCVPVAVAAWLRRIPLMIYLPDIAPGKAVRFIARLADAVAVTHEAALQHFPAGLAFVTGYPVRPELRAADRGSARSRLSIEDDRKLVLVFGGSQGARRLNRAVADAAAELLESVDLIHISGPLDFERAEMARATLPAPLQKRYRLYEYLHSDAMADALAAADLAVCRAGASSLGELPAMGLPALLVPLPISGGHQWPNARMLEAEGAALVVDDAEMDGERLREMLHRAFDSSETLARMKSNARRLDHPEAAGEIGRRLLDLAGAAA